MSTLIWIECGPDDEPYWELLLVRRAPSPAQKEYYTVFGRMYHSDKGPNHYVVMTAGPSPATSYRLDDLSLEDAKHAAKMLLMVGRQ